MRIVEEWRRIREKAETGSTERDKDRDCTSINANAIQTVDVGSDSGASSDIQLRKKEVPLIWWMRWRRRS